MSHSFVSQYVHIIFSTKERRKLIRTEINDRLFSYIGGILREKGCLLKSWGATEDHVHLLISVNPQVSLSEIIRIIKANSSKWARESLGLSSFNWQIGYGAFSVSFSDIKRIEAYFKHQKEHHKKVEFKEELAELLKNHSVQYNDKNI